MHSLPSSALSSCGSLCQRLSLPKPPVVWENTWSSSVESDQPEATPFLQESFIRECCASLKIPATAIDALVETAIKIRTNPALNRLAWHCYWLWFQAKQNPQLSTWSAPGVAGNILPPLFYANIALGGVPDLRARHQALGIPSTITEDTLSDLPLWLGEYQKQHGCWGLDQHGWLQGHFTLKTFKLGRLQFELTHNKNFPFRAFRQRLSQRIVLLAENGLTFRTAGQFAGADGGGSAAAETWESSLTITDDYTRGQPVNANGVVERETMTLSNAEWEMVFSNLDSTVNVHIPATGSLTFSACEDSFAQADDFFPRYYPEHNFKAYLCCSWLLDPQLRIILPSTSNLVRHCNCYYLCPHEHASSKQTYERVFGLGIVECPSEPAPEATSLQRSIIEYVQGGGCLRSGNGVRLPGLRGDQPWRWFDEK